MATVFTAAQIDSACALQQDYGAISNCRKRNIVMRSRLIKFDEIATVTSQALAQADSYPVLNVFAGELIMNAGINIMKVATGAATIDMGFTGGDVDGLLNTIVANDLSFTAKTGVGVLLPLSIDTTDTVDLLEVSGAATLAGCIIRAWLMIEKGTNI